MSVSEQPLQIASDPRVDSACPPSPYVYGHCATEDEHGFPYFRTKAELQADAGWSCYVQT
eukprot:CAMPEP_0194485412 /NCGR_PEP_ID=MMETSP0253-20130528/6436_1 /TAXON_ID=2966 /ORGANISM="Noctiluca scintillans" /LENGTH=59 /DNA_ID=CAMNT_0039325397 /DNA_START=5 /DNA_END=181 /DNA_ORIENTATION=-